MIMGHTWFSFNCLSDFTVSHHPEDVTILSIGHDKDMMKLNEQVNASFNGSVNISVHSVHELWKTSLNLCSPDAGHL